MFKDTEFWDQLAINTYKSLLKKNPDTSFLHQNLALAYMRTNKTNKAITSLKRAIKCDNKNIDAYYHLATFYYQTKQYRQALIQFKKYKKLVLKNPLDNSSTFDEFILNL